jgi:hypothetical protein
MNLKETRVVEATHSMLFQAFYPILWCRFFDKAAVKTDKDENPETPPTPWRLCTITQVWKTLGSHGRSQQERMVL